VLELILSFSTMVSLLGLVAIRLKLRPYLKGYKTLRKLVGIKLLVHVVITESFFFFFGKSSLQAPFGNSLTLNNTGRGSNQPLLSHDVMSVILIKRLA
jgi:hypothetical protein